MRKVPLTLARKQFERLVESVSRGEPLIITRNVVDVAALIPPEKVAEMAISSTAGDRAV